MKKKRLLIFIITYKAEKRVYKVYKTINFKKLKKFNTNVLIGDDCSLDSTSKYIKKLNKESSILNYYMNKKNIGYGANIKKCISYAIKNKFNYAIMIHGDGQYSPKYIPEMINCLCKDNYQAVTGSRLLRGVPSALKGGMPFYKLAGNIFLTKFFNFTFKTKFKDSHTGLWGYNLTVFNKIELKKLPDTFNFDQLFRIKLIQENFKIKEIPIQTIYKDERSQLHILYAVKFFFITLNYFFRLLILKKNNSIYKIKNFIFFYL